MTVTITTTTTTTTTTAIINNNKDDQGGPGDVTVQDWTALSGIVCTQGHKDKHSTAQAVQSTDTKQ